MKKSFLKKFINNVREEFPLQLVNSLVYLLDFFILAPSHLQNSNNSKAILIVRTDLLGDFIIWINAFKLINKKFSSQNYKIILLGNEAWADLAKKTKLFDVIIPLNRKKYFKNFSYRKNILVELNRYNFEYLFQTAYSRDFAVADSIARNVNSKNKIAFKRKKEAEFSIWNLLSNRWYTSLLPINKKNVFEFYRAKEYLDSLDIKIEQYSTNLTGYFKKDVTAGNYFIIFPGANAARRCLEPFKLAELIIKIKNETGWQCCLCGSKAETNLGEILQSEIPFSINNLIGKTTLVELGDIILNAKLVLGNETGPLHYAAALNTETICFLGGGHFERFMPYDEKISGNIKLPLAVYNKMDCFKCNWRCIYTDKKNEVVPCISTLTADYIWNNIKNVLTIILKTHS